MIFWYGMQPEPRKIPRTIENTREIDETLAQPDDEEVFLLLISHDLLYGSLCQVFKTLAQSDGEEAFLLLVSHSQNMDLYARCSNPKP